MTEAPRRVSQYHSALGPTIEALKTSTAYQGMVSANGPGCVHLKVAIGQKARALTFLDDLFRAAEKRGFTIERAKPDRYKAHYRQQELVITNSKHSCSISLRTLTKRTERQDVDRSPMSYASRFDFTPRETFLLEIGAFVGPGEYRDGVRKKLEDRIDDLVQQIADHFDACVLRDAEEAAAAERRLEEERRYNERLKLMRIEKERDETARRLLANWRDARDMRLVVSALKSRLGDAAAWIGWLEDWCDRVDPTITLSGDPFPTLP